MDNNDGCIYDECVADTDIVRNRTKSGGLLVRTDVLGWEADIQDRGHRRGFVIRIRRTGEPNARTFHTTTAARWAQARQSASDLLIVLGTASGAPLDATLTPTPPVVSGITEVTTAAEAAKFAQGRLPLTSDAPTTLPPAVEPADLQGGLDSPSPRSPRTPVYVSALANGTTPTATRAYRSEIRPSQANQLSERVRGQNYDRYLRKVVLAEVRGFHGEVVEFDYPVTAIVGPNGGGKTTILGAAALAYTAIKPRQFFAKSGTFDASMLNWRIEWELIDRAVNRRDTFRRTATFKSSKWYRDKLERDVVLFGVSRTVPASERIELRKCASNHFSVPKERIAQLTPAVIDASEKILGKDISQFSHLSVDPRGRVSLLTGRTERGQEYSEFHFGAGESSVIRMVMQIELMPDQSLILIEEIENGLHPVATARMVEYLMDVAGRKRAQAIFTTHSNDALRPLPSDAIWASIRWRTFKGKLDIQALRAIEGTVEAQLAIFTEDEFSRSWLVAMLRSLPGIDLESIEVYGLTGDSMAVGISRFHNQDPSRRFPSICYIDGDSRQVEDATEVFRLPGQTPETYVFDRVVERLDDFAGILAVALHRRYEDAATVGDVAREVRRTNRDPHLLFSQVGRSLGLIPEPTVRDAFLSVWCQAYPEEVAGLLAPVAKVAGVGQSPPANHKSE